MPTETVAVPAPDVQTVDLSSAWNRQQVDADTAGMIVLHAKRSPGDGQPAVEIPVYVLAASVATVEPSIKLDGTTGGAIIEVDGGSRRYVVESAAAVLSLLARMREAHRGS